MNNYNPRLLGITMDEGDVIRKLKRKVKILEAEIKKLKEEIQDRNEDEAGSSL